MPATQSTPASVPLVPHEPFGAVGWPAVVPDHISLWGSLLQFRRTFDQFVNLRPCRLMPGVRSPLADREPGDIDFLAVREGRAIAERVRER
ncbi:hypothetical protein KIF24_07010 [Micromonospora sp. Llam7]|nr:isocitrate/isopropylmalate family dehydrogenase [Micromonospora tarapacensis]MBX7265800.1 hypothetical protein [Micromonospora tarapacensis]